MQQTSSSPAPRNAGLDGPGPNTHQPTEGILSVTGSFGTAVVVERVPATDQTVWEKSFAGRMEDHRYYHLTQATLGAHFAHRYLLLKGGDGRSRAVQPFLIVLQDLVSGVPVPVRRVIERVRQQ